MKTTRRVLGVVIPFAIAVGLTLLSDAGTFGKGQTINVGAVLVVVILGELIAGFLCGLLLRSLWAMLIAPLALALGVTLVQNFTPGAISGMDAFNYVAAIILLVIFVGVASIPAALAALVGALVSKRTAREQQAAGNLVSARHAG